MESRALQRADVVIQIKSLMEPERLVWLVTACLGAQIHLGLKFSIIYLGQFSHGDHSFKVMKFFTAKVRRLLYLFATPEGIKE